MTLPISYLEIIKYKRFDRFKVEFRHPLTLISGGNGTGKSSILHLVSNTFQKPTAKYGVGTADRKLLSDISGSLNLRINELTRGDMKSNDPAGGRSGTIYRASGESFNELNFRRHATDQSKIPRYYLKPYYAVRGASMPVAAVAYLGLSRLITQGEFDDDSASTARRSLPPERLASFREKYKRLLLMDVDVKQAELLGGLKRRLEFLTSKSGVDSNTISAGQDNVSVILSTLEYLIAFKGAHPELGAILLIDEIDATLHPDLQIKLVRLLLECAREHSIQVIATTQSLELIDYASRTPDCDIVYLIDRANTVVAMSDITPASIRMHLRGVTVDEFGGYESRKVAVFTEDAEARAFLKVILDFCETFHPDLRVAASQLDVIEINLGCEQLKSLFRMGPSSDVLRGSVCILDGDAGQPGGMDKKDQIIALPGGKRPEEVFYDHVRSMVEGGADQFEDPEWIDRGFSAFYLAEMLQELEGDLGKIKNGELKKREREVYKDHFGKHPRLFEFVGKAWCREPESMKSIIKFLKDLEFVTSRACGAMGLDSSKWASSIREVQSALLLASTASEA